MVKHSALEILRAKRRFEERPEPAAKTVEFPPQAATGAFSNQSQTAGWGTEEFELNHGLKDLEPTTILLSHTVCLRAHDVSSPRHPVKSEPIRSRKIQVRARARDENCRFIEGERRVYNAHIGCWVLG